MVKGDIYVAEKRKPSKTFVYLIFGLLVFLFIYFPFLAVNLRYQMSVVFSKIFDTIGKMFLTVGGAIMAISVLSVFIGRSVKTKYFIIGIVLLWIGCWCTGTILEIFGFEFGTSSASGGGTGYH